MADVTLINPPSPFISCPYDAQEPPLGLLYLASVLERDGFSVEYLDLALDPEWEAKAAAVCSPVAGVTCLSASYNHARRISQLLPKSTVKIVGGPHPSALPRRTMDESSFDIVVAGEAETIISDIVQKAIRGENQSPIIQGNPTPAGSILKPARHLASLHRYECDEPVGPITSLITSRGCHFNCRFCYQMYPNNPIRYHLLDVVLEEIGELSGEHGFTRLDIVDDSFITDIERVKMIATAMQQHGVSYYCLGRADEPNEAVMRMLAETGCGGITFGVESGSQRMLDAMNKTISVERQKEAVMAAKRHGLKVRTIFILGFPGEDEESVEATRRFFFDTMPDAWLILTYSPLPGTDVWSHPDRFGITWMSDNFDEFGLSAAGGRGGSSFEAGKLTRLRLKNLHRSLFDSLQGTVQKYAQPYTANQPCDSVAQDS